MTYSEWQVEVDYKRCLTLVVGRTEHSLGLILNIGANEMLMADDIKYLVVIVDSILVLLLTLIA